jgi:hypothetical protein
MDAASGAARSDAEAECLGRSRGGLCSKLHACADRAGAAALFGCYKLGCFDRSAPQPRNTVIGGGNQLR